MPEEQVQNRPKRGREATQFKPGQSGNPGGRPKGSISLTARLRRKVEELIPGDPRARTYADALVERLLTEGIKGDMQAMKVIFERLDLKVTQPVLVATTDPDSLAGMTDDEIYRAFFGVGEEDTGEVQARAAEPRRNGRRGARARRKTPR